MSQFYFSWLVVNKMADKIQIVKNTKNLTIVKLSKKLAINKISNFQILKIDINLLVLLSKS